jgi:hypothetical protein
MFPTIIPFIAGKRKRRYYLLGVCIGNHRLFLHCMHAPVVAKNGVVKSLSAVLITWIFGVP